MLTNIAVVAAFDIIVKLERKQLLVQYKYCPKKPFAKHTSQQRKHFTQCQNYLQYQKNICKKNAITRQADKDKIQQLFLSIITLFKQQQLNRLAALAVFYGERALGIFDDPWMEEFFMQGLGYKPLTCNQLSTTLLDDIYLETKLQVDNLLKANDMINIVLDESNNQSRD